MSENVDFVRSLYDAYARGDVATVLDALTADAESYEAENFIYDIGGPFVGPDAVMEGVFSRVGQEWDDFSAEPDEILDAGDTVVSLGRYRGTYKETGKAVDAQYVHVFRINDGKIVKFNQFTDTAQFLQAAGQER